MKKCYLFSHLACYRSPTARTRSSLRTTVSSVKDEQHSPAASTAQTAGHSSASSWSGSTSSQQSASPSTAPNVDWNGLVCPPQASRHDSWNSDIGNSLQLVGPHYPTTEQAPSQTFVQPGQYRLRPSEIGQRVSNQLNGAVFSSSIHETEPRLSGIGAFTPDHRNMEQPYSESSLADISFQRQGGFDIGRPVTSNQWPSSQPRDILQRAPMSTPPLLFSRNILTNPPTAPRSQVAYSPDDYATLADQAFLQDATTSRSIHANWTHHDSDIGAFVPYLGAGADLGHTSTPLNDSLSNSYYRLPLNRYHDYRTRPVADTPEMVRLWPRPCFLRLILTRGWEGGIMPARVLGSTNLLIGYHPILVMVNIFENLIGLTGALRVVLVLESLYKLHAYLDNMTGLKPTPSRAIKLFD
jgi:hypothetical protein